MMKNITRGVFVVVTLFSHVAWADNCLDVKYINYTSLHYSAVSRAEILNRSDKEFTVDNKYLVDLYLKYMVDGEAGADDRAKDYRVAFKPCEKSEWAFYALDGSAFFVNRLVKLPPKEEKAMDDEMRNWNDKFGLMQAD